MHGSQYWTPHELAGRATLSARMNAPTFEGSAAIFHFEDCDGAIANMRASLKEAISSAGGSAAEGGGDRSLSRAPNGVPSAERSIGPHLPDIVHSTVVRWATDPADREAVAKSFVDAAKTWTPIDITVDCAKAVFEDIPYMHIPNDGSRVWWVWTAS